MKNTQTQNLEIQIAQTLEALQSPLLFGIGIDVEELSDWKNNFENKYFVEYNFNPEEIEYCQKSSHPQASLAGLWCAKEAILKAASNFKPHEKVVHQFGGSVKEIEIFHSHNGCPLVLLSGAFEKWRIENGIREIKISISHSDHFVIAVALAI